MIMLASMQMNIGLPSAPPTRLRRRWATFLRDDRGSAAVEFVAVLPLAAGILVLGAEYGNGLMTREALDSAVRDATRILSRAPVELEGEGRVPYAHFEDLARNVVADRTGEDPTRFEVRLLPVGGTGQSARWIVETEAEIVVDLPLLSFFERIGIGGVATGVSMTARDSAPYVGEAPAGALGCSRADRVMGVAGCV